MDSELQEQFQVSDQSNKGQDVKMHRLDSETMEYSQSLKRSWSNRTFGKLEAGSMRGSIFTMISTAVGAGCLALPLAFKYVGVILAPLFILLGLAISYTGVVSIAVAAEKYNIYHYPTLVRKVLGNFWAVFLEINIIVYVVGIVMAFQILIGQFVPSIFQSIGIQFEGDRWIFMTAACVGIMIPLSFIRDLSGLRFISILSGLTLIYITILIIAQFNYFIGQNNYETELYYARIDLNIFSAYSLSLWAYTCHTNVTQIQGELKDSSLRRMKKLSKRGLFSLFIPYCVLGLFGYLSTLQNTPNIIIMRHTPDSIHNDWLIVIARVMMTFTLVMAIPVNLVPCRNSLQKMIFKIDGQAPFIMQILPSHAGIAVSILVSTLLIGIFYPNILVLFNVLGGICATCFTLLIPCLLRVEMSGKPKTHWSNFLILSIASLLSICGVISVALSI